MRKTQTLFNFLELSAAAVVAFRSLVMLEGFVKVWDVFVFGFLACIEFFIVHTVDYIWAFPFIVCSLYMVLYIHGLNGNSHIYILYTCL